MRPDEASSSGLKHRRLRLSRDREAWLGYLFVMPQTVGFGVFVLGPLVGVFYLSFQYWDFFRGDITSVGFANYQRLFNDPQIVPVLITTLIFVTAFVVLNVCLGLVLALAANRAIRATPILKGFYFSPVVVTLVAWALVFTLILQDNGLLSEVLRAVSIDPPNWLRKSGWALAWVIFAQVLKSAGVIMVIFLAGLQGIPGELKEAARIDGAGSSRIFRHVTLPLLTPYVFFVIVISVIGSFKTFALIQLMTSGGPGTATTVLSYYVYQLGFERFEMGYAAAAAMLLLGVVAILTGAQFLIRKWWVFGESI